jgi:HD-like signal output (HDOD) protein
MTSAKPFPAVSSPEKPEPVVRPPQHHAAEQPPVRVRLARILAGRDFPALSQQIADTITALDDNAGSTQRLTNIVLRENSLTLSVVRTANSAHYRRADKPIQSVTRAVMLLGARTVRQLASSLLLFENYRKHSAGLKELMLLSLLTANHARAVALRLGMSDPEEAHLSGMCRNLGEVLVACHFPVDYARIHTLVRERKHHEASAALAVLGFRYEELGQALCRHWGMPEAVTESMQSRVSQASSQVSAVTAFAHDLSSVMYRRDVDSGDARTDLDAVVARHAPRIGLTRAQVAEVVSVALEETRELVLTANVRIDALRMKQLSEAACTALGVTALGSAIGDETEDDASAARLAPLREQLRQELESKVDPAAEVDLGQLLLLALEGALRGTPFDRVVACVLSPDRTRIRARSGLGFGMEQLLVEFDLPMTPQGGAIPAALLQGKAVYVPGDRAMTVLEQRLAGKLGIAQFGLFPIIVDGQIVACLYGDRAVREPLPDAEAVEHITALTALVVRAIDLRRSMTPSQTATTRVTAPIDASQLPPKEKAALVMRLLQGESLAAVAAGSNVDAITLELWRTEFLAGAIARLGASPDSGSQTRTTFHRVPSR